MTNLHSLFFLMETAPRTAARKGCEERKALSAAPPFHRHLSDQNGTWTCVASQSTLISLISARSLRR